MKDKDYILYITYSFLVTFFVCAMVGATANNLNAKDHNSLNENYTTYFNNHSLNLITVTGVVTNEDGESLPGVNIIVKGTNIGTSTDVDGKYKIEIPADKENVTLIFSFIGYSTQEVKLAGKNIINVELSSDSQALEEVVVVGFGTQEKVSVTGSISSISAKEIEKSPAPSLSNAISGKLPGIITRQSSGEPGYDAAQVYIRGLGTWGNRSPLILVDGVERDMNNINAHEIESFSILKDASATAVYGVRGANGVILINTKRGEKGKPKVTFRSETASLKFLRLPEFIDGTEYAILMNEGLANVGKSLRWSEEEIEKFRTGSDPYFYPNVDWAEEILRKSSSQSINNLNVSGGNEVVRYFTNVGFTMQNGIYKDDNLNNYNTNDKMKRYNFRSNVDVNLSKSLLIKLGIGGIIQRADGPGDANRIFNSIRITPPIAFPVRNPDGTPGGVATYLGSNPWASVTQSGYIRQHRNTLQGTFGAEYDLSSIITEGLSISGKFAYDHYSFNQANRPKIFAVKQYLGKDPETGEDLYQEHREEQPLGYGLINSANRAIYTEGIINYNRTFNKIHNVSGMVLYNRREYVDLTAGSSILNLPYRRQGIAGRLTYDFDHRYLLELNFGYNGSENFPKGKKYGFFPSISGGWVISDENFWDVDFINYLKFRASHGQVGNDQIGGRRFLFLTKAFRNGTPYPFGENQQWYNGMGEDVIGNPNVTWELATKSNIGVDLELFDNKINLQTDIFYEHRDGILIQRQQVPAYAGFPASAIPYGNLGEAINKGIDALLEVRNTTQSGLFYSFRSNFTFARNKIIENDEPTPRYPYLSGKGISIDQPFGLVALGIFQDEEEINSSPTQTFMHTVRPGDIKYKDINGDGVINIDDRQPIGFPRMPEIMFGFGGTIGYKGFDLSVYFTGATNTSMFFGGWGFYPFVEGPGNGNVYREYYENRWTEDNPNAKYPAPGEGNSPNNFQSSTLWQKDASYIRFRNAEIGYNFPAEIMARYGISNLRLFVNGTNLHTWDKIKIVNPEATNGQGFYPLQRSLNAGLEISFN